MSGLDAWIAGPAVVLFFLMGCVSPPGQDNRLCPCSEGWVCVEGFCVAEEVACPGECGDGILCPQEACDDGDSNNCTVACNAACSGPAPADNPICEEPNLYFAALGLEVLEPHPDGANESYTAVVHSSNAYYQDVRVNFGHSHELNEGRLAVTPSSGSVVIKAGDTTSDQITIEIQPESVDGARRRSVYIALLNSTAGNITMPAIYTLDVRNREVTVPEVASTVPASGELMVATNARIEIEFTVPMHTAYTAEAFSIDPTVDGEITWEQDDHRLVFTPFLPLAEGQSYVVNLAATAESADGVSLGEYSFAFETQSALDVALIMTVLSVLR